MKINSKMIFLVLFIILASTAPVLALTLTDVIMGILTFVIGDALDGIMAYFGTIAILAAWTPFILLVLLVILPAITVYTIIYGFLMEIRIFRNKTVNLIIALSIGSSAIFLPLPPFGVPVFGLLVAFLFGAMAWWAIFVFSIMFFVGVWYLFLTRRAKWGTTSAVYGAYQDEAKGLSFELRAINESGRCHEKNGERNRPKHKSWNRSFSKGINRQEKRLERKNKGNGRNQKKALRSFQLLNNVINRDYS